MSNADPGLTAYLAADGFEEELRTELAAAAPTHIEQYGRLFLVNGPVVSAAWAQNTWYAARRTPIASISDAAAQLRAIQRNWALYSHTAHRRAALIQERLPPVSARPLSFGDKVPAAPLGSWTLLDSNTLLASPRCSSAFPNGELRFVEDRETPPSRAYLKLWEALTLIGARPQPGERCVDIGASPGGWSWVVQSTGAEVMSIDKAPLDPRIAALPRITTRQQSAFALDPRELGALDWFFSDMICYPERLYRLVQTWLAAGTCRNFVCTIKFQGATDHESARRFAEIPNSRLMHLFHNKHELTWVRLG